ncbi:hypothetical protein J5N97_015185 [Dioscorea zingiberensis]|uniref:Uncharacterized protein n=1 Tax=Dioscorea zingiberensis TaxID=325984 RepID=A0A9D5HKE9_9LILI|nr:hypothetical protein J5N97_015185 [Dioscorea zingiberensis]
MFRFISRCKSSVGTKDGFQCLLSTSQPQRLAGKVAVITGAASGIGKATATEFIRQGAYVILADIKQEQGQATAVELGPNAIFTPCDVTKESDVSSSINLAVKTHGRVDIVYNNAGITGSLAPSITELNLTDFDRVMAVNVGSVVAGIKHAARAMIPRQAGCILCTASIAAIVGSVAGLNYSVSKRAMAGAVRSAAAELSAYGVRVNGISPHAIRTGLAVNKMLEMFPGLMQERVVEMIQGTGELKGAQSEPEDIARAALFLASDEATLYQWP